MPDENGNLLPGDEGYVAPAEENPPIEGDETNPPNNPDIVNEAATVPEQNQEVSEYDAAKSKFAELFATWNTIDLNERETDAFLSLREELTRLYEIIQRYENPQPEQPVVDNAASVETEQPLVETPVVKTFRTEKPGNINVFGNERYFGSDVVNPDNPLMTVGERNHERENH